MAASEGDVPRTSIRVMTDADVAAAYHIWNTIGLHEGRQTIYSFRSVDPDGFVVCVNDETGAYLQSANQIACKLSGLD